MTELRKKTIVWCSNYSLFLLLLKKLNFINYLVVRFLFYRFVL